MIIIFRGFAQEFFSVSASVVCDSRNWKPRSNSFVRAPSSGGGSNAPRPAVYVPHLPGGDRVRGLSEASKKKCAFFFCIYFGRYTPELFLDLGIYMQSLNEKNIWENIYFQVGIISKVTGFLFRPRHTVFMSHIEAFGPFSYACCVVACRYRISRLNTFVRAFVVFEGGRSLPNIITPSVRADSSSWRDTTYYYVVTECETD